MKNLKTKCLIGIIAASFSFFFGSIVITSSNEGEIYDVGWKSWDVTANVLENGDMEVHEKLVYFNDTYNTYRVSESKIAFNKSTATGIDGNDTSRLKEGSFTVDVYKDDNYYFKDQSVPSSNAYDQDKYDDCLGFSWVEGCYDERGIPVSGDGDFEKVFIYIEEGLPNGLTIEFNYVVEDVITKYADYSVLNWKFQGAYDYADNKNVNLTINLPEGGEILDKNISNTGFSKDEMTVMGFGTLNAKIASQSGSQIKVKSKQLFDEYGDEIEMFVSIPSSKVDLFPKIKAGDTNYSSTNGYEKLKGVIDEALLYEEGLYNPYKFLEALVVVACLVVTGINVFIIIHCYKKYDKELKSNFDFEFYREIPNANYSPSVASYLVYEQKLTKDSLNAELMDLIRRKYIIIDINGQDLTSKNANFIMTLDQNRVNTSVDLTPSERYLLDWFFIQIGKDGVLSMDELDSYMNNHVNAERYNKNNFEWNEKVRLSGQSRGWFDDVSGAKKFLMWGVLTFLATFLLFGFIMNNNLTWIAILATSLVLGSGIVVATYPPSIKRKSQEGIDEYTKWMAFKKFLEEFSTFEDYPVPSLIVWEHYMVYATMFGIADLVEKQLKTKFKDLQRTEEFESHPYFYYRYYRHISYRVNHAMVIGSQAIAREKARQSGSRGRSGGFGGGSSFGGGGRGGSFR